MAFFDWIQLFFFLALLTLLFKGMGEYIRVVFDPAKKGFIERLLRLSGSEQTWGQYLGALLAFSAMSGLVTFILLFFQSRFPLNPQGLPDVPFALALNIAVSFLTNTDWQAYSGETTLSYFSQMAALSVQNFFSPAVALCAAAVLCRAIAREGKTTVGNFWVDLTRVLYYLLLPLAVVFGLYLMQRGSPQNFSPYVEVQTLQSGTQLLVQGPIASQEAIKAIGTNGGGFTHANSAHPFENPTQGTNFFQAAAFFLIAFGQLYYFGKKTGCLRAVWSVFATVLLVFTAGVILCALCERGNFEGKELRFGVFGSSLYTVAASVTSCGAVNAMLSSFTPLGGMIPLALLQLGKAVFGGAGMGVCNLVLFTFILCFFAGTLRGRSAHFLGKRIGNFEAGMALLAFAFFFLAILGFTAISFEAHRFSEVFYAYSSTAANNGSALASLNANTPWFNYTLAAAMLIGRFGTLVPAFVFAGALVKKKREHGDAALLPVSGISLVVLLIAAMIVLGLVVFLPGYLLGPLLENAHFRGG